MGRATKRLRFLAEPHHELIYADDAEPVRGGQVFSVDEETYKRLMALPGLALEENPKTDSGGIKPATRPQRKPARGSSKQKKED